MSGRPSGPGVENITPKPSACSYHCARRVTSAVASVANIGIGYTSKALNVPRVTGSPAASLAAGREGIEGEVVIGPFLNSPVTGESRLLPMPRWVTIGAL